MSHNSLHIDTSLPAKAFLTDCTPRSSVTVVIACLWATCAYNACMHVGTHTQVTPMRHSKRALSSPKTPCTSLMLNLVVCPLCFLPSYSTAGHYYSTGATSCHSYAEIDLHGYALGRWKTHTKLLWKYDLLD